MLKQSHSKTKERKSGHLSFYFVMLLCMAMVSVACWFAYSQTKNQLVVELDSAMNATGNTKQTDAADVKVMEMETAVARERIPVTEPESEDTEEPETEDIKSVAGVQPLQTAPTEPQPFTQSAAVIDAPETAPVIQDAPETMPETVTMPESAAVSAEPACYPLDGEILEYFSNGELVKSSTTGVWQSHNGIDIAGTLGDTVCAMSTGVVESIENNALWGVTVTIDHRNGIYSRYCNLNTGLTVSAGDKVEAGTVIGAIGNTADAESAMESHLHFEVLRGEIYLDPIAYIASTQTTAESAD